MKLYGIKAVFIEIVDFKFILINSELIYYVYKLIDFGNGYVNIDFENAFDFDDRMIELDVVDRSYLNDKYNLIYVGDRVENEKELLKGDLYKKILFKNKIILFKDENIAKYIKLKQIKEINENIEMIKKIFDEKLKNFDKIEEKIIHYLI